MTFPAPLRILGKRQVEQIGKWIPSLATYGVAGSLGFLYITDWKVVVQYFPYYGSKFDE